MKPLDKEQIKGVLKWMNEWEQLNGTFIPVRFEEDMRKMQKEHQNKQYPLTTRECFNEVLIDIIEEISLAKGRYSPDRMEHACNTIQDMQELAKKALDLIKLKNDEQQPLQPH